jgi:cyclic pyranopterin phosphate synthase
MSDLSHLDSEGRPQMVDISGKPPTRRHAVVTAALKLKKAHLAALARNPKGNVFVTASVAGIQAGKRCSELVPLCHPIALTNLEVHIEAARDSLIIRAVAESDSATGVEMEAYVAASIAGVTLIDMLKGVDPDLELTGLKLMEKSGGKTRFQRDG